MNLQGKRAAIVTLGCKVNQYETDAMYGMLKEAGVTMVDPKEAADIYIVNTCSVTNMAERKSRQMLHRAKKKNPDVVVVAVGCYAPCIGMDKQEIVDIAEKIGTFETSIQPFEDCCTIFVAKHPVTKGNLKRIKKSEEHLEDVIDDLMKEAIDSTEIIHVK